MSIEMVLLDFRIDVTIDLEDVDPTVIVVIHKAGTPTNILGIYREAGHKRLIGEGSIPIVVIQVRRVVRKVRFENVEPAVSIGVAAGNTHPSLLPPFIVVGPPSRVG